jgi:flagellar FliL protein
MARIRQPRGAEAAGGPRGKARAIAGFVLVTALAIGAGVFSGTRLAGTVETNVIKRIEATPPALAADAAMTDTLMLKKLAPIVTNLAAPANTWVRLEAALLIDRKSAVNAEPLMGTIAEDMLAFLRSVTAQQLEGAPGLKNLREDLSERIAIRSKGLVRDVVIETLVVQ